MPNVRTVVDGVFAPFREPGRRSTRYVSDGRVWCPNRGDIDVDTCLRCPRFVGRPTMDGLDAIACCRAAMWVDPEIGRGDGLALG